ncbi:hypothetical protein MVEN_02353400 [Mycena venus]|uniref:Uncharacterized protein n=1 Tax=Mycena venus TaxID=2733690 RepID=A0A8H6X2U1_9AGAR|nr:hypothetical protein MVEN_02353400 [Mycena venus]
MHVPLASDVGCCINGLGQNPIASKGAALRPTLDRARRWIPIDPVLCLSCPALGIDASQPPPTQNTNLILLTALWVFGLSQPYGCGWKWGVRLHDSAAAGSRRFGLVPSIRIRPRVGQRLFSAFAGRTLGSARARHMLRQRLHDDLRSRYVLLFILCVPRASAAACLEGSRWRGAPSHVVLTPPSMARRVSARVLADDTMGVGAGGQDRDGKEVVEELVLSVERNGVGGGRGSGRAGAAEGPAAFLGGLPALSESCVLWSSRGASSRSVVKELELAALATSACAEGGGLHFLRALALPWTKSEEGRGWETDEAVDAPVLLGPPAL